MSRLRTLTALATAAGVLATAPAAMAHTTTVGHASQSPTQNLCVLDIKCTYVNYQNGKPADVVKRTGRITSWKLNAGSVGGTVRLRVLRPVAGGKLKFIRSSSLRTVTDDTNTYAANLPVRKGDVLGLTNTTSGLYMSVGVPGQSIRYFNYDQKQNDGASGKPSLTATQLHLELAATVKG